MEKELNHIPLLGYIDNKDVPEDVKRYIKQQNEVRNLLNDIVDTTNYLMKDKLASYKMTNFYLKTAKRYEQLISEGIDVDSLTLRELGKELNLKHPQTVKNFLSKYKMLNK
jgi:hypothetical protein